MKNGTFYTCLEFINLQKYINNNTLYFKVYITFATEEDQTYHSIPNIVFKIQEKNNMKPIDSSARLSYIDLVSLNKELQSGNNKIQYITSDKKYGVGILLQNNEYIIHTKDNNKPPMSYTINKMEYDSLIHILNNLVNQIPFYTLHNMQSFEIKQISNFTKKVFGQISSINQNICNIKLPEETHNIPQEPMVGKTPISEVKNKLQNDFEEFNNKQLTYDIINNYSDFCSFIDPIFKSENIYDEFIDGLRYKGIELFKTVSDSKYSEYKNLFLQYYTYKQSSPERCNKMFMYYIEPHELTKEISKIVIWLFKLEYAALYSQDISKSFILETILAPILFSYLPFINLNVIEEIKNDNFIQDQEIEVLTQLIKQSSLMYTRFPNYWNEMKDFITNTINEEKVDESVEPLKSEKLSEDFIEEKENTDIVKSEVTQLENVNNFL